MDDGHPLNMPDQIQIALHCHRPDLTAALAAATSFCDRHGVEEPDMHFGHQAAQNPMNGEMVEWYEVTVTFPIDPDAKITITQPQGEPA